MKPYQLPLKEAQAEFTEKKSRFIGYIAPVATENEARAFLQKIRAAHREASHCVYAYRLMENAVTRHSDDGEPSGSAGMPLLNVFLKQDIFDFCCVAVRYYGGIQLGAGGLVRAYSQSGAAALEAAGVATMRQVQRVYIILPYPHYENMKRLLTAAGATITAEDFGAAVRMDFSLISEALPALEKQITELTAGTITINLLGASYEKCL